MVETELFTDHSRDTRQQIAQISNGCDRLRDLRKCLKLGCTGPNLVVSIFKITSTILKLPGALQYPVFK